MRRRNALVSAIAFAVIACTNVFANSSDDKVARAQELIGQARAALGGEAKIKAIQSLTASGKLRQVMRRDDAEDQIEGEIELNFLLPDKYLRTDSTPLPAGDGEMRRIVGINGDQVFRDAQATGGGMVM